MQTFTKYFQPSRPPTFLQQVPTNAEIVNALTPLFNYFNDNFAIMKETLTESAMVMVMTRLWKDVLATIESLLVPPLSDKPSQQRQLTQQELDTVFKWLQVRVLDPTIYIYIFLADPNSYSLISSMLSTKKLAFQTAFPWMF